MRNFFFSDQKNMRNFQADDCDKKNKKKGEGERAAERWGSEERNFWFHRDFWFHYAIFVV